MQFYSFRLCSSCIVYFWCLLVGWNTPKLIELCSWTQHNRLKETFIYGRKSLFTAVYVFVCMLFFDVRNKFFDPKITQQPCPTLPSGNSVQSIIAYALKEPIHFEFHVAHNWQDKMNRIGRGKRYLVEKRFSREEEKESAIQWEAYSVMENETINELEVNEIREAEKNGSEIHSIRL